MKRVFLLSLLLGACAQPAAEAPVPGEDLYARRAAAVESDANVYTFRHEGPNPLGTAAVTAHPTAGPDAAPAGTLAGPMGQAKAEAAAAFYAENTLCNGVPFRLASDAVSRYDAATNSWTVFGRCVRA